MKEESKRLEVIKFFVIHSNEKILSLLLFGKNGSTNSFLISSYFGKRLLIIQLHPKGRNSVSTLST